MDDISRDVIEGVGPNGSDVRLYDYHGDKLPSVTSVLKARDEDLDALHDWQERNDGVGDNADHEHIFWYSRQVGTLAHWYALRELDHDLEWTEDEQDSFYKLCHIDELTDPDEHPEVHDSTPREVLYSVTKSQHGAESWGEFYDRYEPYQPHAYYSIGLLKHAWRDIQFFVESMRRLWDHLDITRDDVVAVEQFLFVPTLGFAGQVDLVYEDADGHTVVADLKSSSGCYDKHQLQGAAYAKAIEMSDVEVDSVDRLEVHRAHPRSGESVVHTHRDAPGKKDVHTTDWWTDGYEDLWGEFDALVDTFEYDEADV